MKRMIMNMIANKAKRLISRSVLSMWILALSGGCMDAYSYICRGRVFSNAQTGNILLLGISIYEMNYESIVKYLIPVLSYSIGIVFAVIMQYEELKLFSLHWRQIIVLVELLFFTIVVFLPSDLDVLANDILSFVCGIQVESFRFIGYKQVTTTMCMGNLRNAIANSMKLLRAERYSDKIEYIKRSLTYFFLIFFFVIGAVIEGILIRYIGNFAIVFSIVLLNIFLIILKENKTIGK